MVHLLEQTEFIASDWQILFVQTVNGHQWLQEGKKAKLHFIKKGAHYIASVWNIYINAIHLTDPFVSYSQWGFNSQNVTLM